MFLSKGKLISWEDDIYIYITISKPYVSPLFRCLWIKGWQPPAGGCQNFSARFARHLAPPWPKPWNRPCLGGFNKSHLWQNTPPPATIIAWGNSEACLKPEPRPYLGNNYDGELVSVFHTKGWRMRYVMNVVFGDTLIISKYVSISFLWHNIPVDNFVYTIYTRL